MCCCTAGRATGAAVLMFLSAIPVGLACAAATNALNDTQRRARDLLAELVEIDTSASAGPESTRTAAEHLAQHLRVGGFSAADAQVFVMPNGAGNLVARYRAKQPRHRPVLLVAHLDVVEALASDWSVDPFRFLEKDGYYYGRGVWDNKMGASLLVANFLRLKSEGFEPDRDLVIVLTADEETEQHSIQWLLREHRPQLEAEYALNTDGGRVILRDDRIEAISIETSEKIYASYALEAANAGGHSSLPRVDNAIYDLAGVLERLREHVFPVDLTDATRAFLETWPMPADDPQLPVARALAAGRLDDPAVARLAEYPYLNALARTTCVPTQLSAGHAENALPQSARAVVNCRILPQTDPSDIEVTLRNLAAPFSVAVTVIYPPVSAPPSPSDNEAFRAIRQIARETWPGTPVVPAMATGTSDSLYLRSAGIPSYTIDFLAADPDDDRTHGRDERISVVSYLQALDVWHRLLRSVGQPARTGSP